MTIRRSGVALILAVGIVSVLAVMALGLSLANRLELKAAENTLNGTWAFYIAEAGMAYAVRELKYGSEGAQQSPYTTVRQQAYYRGNAVADGVSIPLNAATHPSFDRLNGIEGDGISGAIGGGIYRVKVIDCASRININSPLPDAEGERHFRNILRILGLSESQAQNLTSYRRSLPGGIFSSREELKLVSGIGPATFAAIEPFITLYGRIDTGPGHTDKVFVNVNTASAPVLRAVLGPLMTTGNPDRIVEQIIARREANPFDGSEPDAVLTNFLSARGEFNAFLYHLRNAGIITSDAELSALLRQTDPNQGVTNSTYLCFDGGGWYDIEVEGAYRNARRTVRQTVKIYETIYQTTKEEFADCAPVTTRVNWKDTCPVNYSSLETWETHPHDLPGAQYIPNALKLGFWDDFSEDYDGSGMQTGDWIAQLERFEINAGNDGMLRTWPAAGFSPGADYFPEIVLDPVKWQFTECSVRLRVIDETDQSKYSLRFNLPWPAVPLGPWWNNSAPAPTAENCPDIADGTVTADTMHILSYNSHQRFLNVSHVKFGWGAIYCSYPQTTDLLTGEIDLYSAWVNYDGTGYIYFAPGPDVKPVEVISEPQIQVFCNDWWWWAHWGWHTSLDGTKTFPLPQYRFDRSVVATISGGLYYTDAFGVYNSGEIRGTIYNIDGEFGFTATEALMDYEGRVIRIVGMGTLFDIDNLRIIPRQGTYTSRAFAPLATPVEWGTIAATVSLPGGALAATEQVFLTTTFSSGENLSHAPGPDDMAPPSALSPAGGTMSLLPAAELRYRIYMYSDYMTSTFNTTYKRSPVVEDVTITYLPHTQVVGRSLR